MHAVRWAALAGCAILAGTTIAKRTAVAGANWQEDVLRVVMDADDRRDGSAETLGQLLSGLRSPDSLTRRIAVRALGRAERPEWLEYLRDALWASQPTVRAEAANAIGQAVYGRAPGRAYEMLTERLAVERDAHVTGRIAQTIGRLAHESAEIAAKAESQILSARAAGNTLAVVRGLESLVRLQRSNGYRMSDSAARHLTDWSNSKVEDPGLDGYGGLAASRLRRLALSALASAGRASEAVLQEALQDPDAGVRRLAILGIASLTDATARSAMIMEAPYDVSPRVRLEILRLYGRFMRAREGCVPLADTVNDPNPHVGLLAVDLLAAECNPADNSVSLLARIAAALPAASQAPVHDWHYAAHAIVALSRAAPDVARQVLQNFELHSQWQVRYYAARAASELDDTETLYRLTNDEHWNVRAVAIEGLKAAVDHAADSTYIENLGASDYQLVMTAARALEGSSRRTDAVRALLTAMQRITRERKETSRDPRRVILSRIAELGSVEDADELRPYLSDFDPVIADSAAAIVSRWTNGRAEPSPQPLPRAAVPTVAQLRTWQQTVATVHMNGGGTFDVLLRPFDAPTNVARFVRLAESGYFNGLTFHRVEPNFVIQGGSPGANEYAGDGPYTRDELTVRGHWRGTVGLSTRGRDTGDGQIFVNLVDNVRLDHNYTIFGEVGDGMEVVDAILEGATIDSVSLRVITPR